MGRVSRTVVPIPSPLPTRPTRPLSQQIVNRSHRSETPKEIEHFNPNDFVSSGSTLLNLALTDHPDCAWQKGKMANIIGDSSSGKTFLALTAFAEASVDKRFDDYRLIMDDAEHANEFNLSKLFGKGVRTRIEPPSKNKAGEDNPSELIEDFHANIRNALKEKQPFLYVLDSMDALDSEADQKKIEEYMSIRAKKMEQEDEEDEEGNGKKKKIKDAKGSYGMAKAKKNSEILRDITGKLEKSDSILLIISQTRDNIDPMSFSTKTRSGGRALKFYATYEMWTASGGPIKSRDRVIGVNSVLKVSKNKITGKVREITIPIYYDYGIDDIGSMIDFLLKEKVWSGGGAAKIDTKGDFTNGMKATLIKEIEDKDHLYKKLKSIVTEEWKAIEDSLKLNRKSKYA